jgi:ABC-type branched-subunit amino acid transport system substrate-binding protein
MLARLNAAALVILIAVPLAVACGSGEKPLSPVDGASSNPRAERAFEAARALYYAGEYDQADSAFATFALDFSGDPLARSAIVFRGRIALLRDDPARARVLLGPIASAAKDDPVTERAVFYHGVALHRLGKAERAVEQLRPFVDRLTDPDENRLLLDTLWRAARDAGDAIAAIAWLDRLLAVAGGDIDPQQAGGWLGELTAGLADRDALEQLADKLRQPGLAWPAVMARLAELEFERGDLDAAAAALDDVRVAGQGDDPAVEEVAELIEQRAAVDLDAVGCVLPLSGNSRLAGEAVMNGVMLGSRVIRFGDDAHSLSVVMRDSAGDPGRTAAAVEELVLEEHVAAIVGPMDGDAADAAAKKAEELGVPIIALTMREGVGAIGRNVFRLFPSNRGEVSALVTRARQRGGSSFAVLYPKDGYGVALRHALREVLVVSGEEPVLEQGYDPDATGFVADAERIAGGSFDVLFVPDTAARLALIAPALAAAGLWSVPPGGEAPEDGRAVQLIAPSTAIDDDLARRAGRYLNGALFATSFHPDASPGAAGFAERVADEYKRQATYFEAYGHDAVLLIAAAIDSGARTRAGIRNWLFRADGDNTADLGLAAPFEGFAADGEANADPWIVTLDEGGFEVLR